MSAAGLPVTADALSRAYGEHAVLHALDLSLEPGTVSVLLGPNGAGKTTLLRLLAGLLRPTSGRVLIDGRPITAIPRPRLARKVAVFTGDISLPFAWTAIEVVLMGRAPHLGPGRLESPADLERARAALERTGATGLAPRPFPNLSSGEQQRVLLARTLCQDAPVVLFDEPTSHLDPAHGLEIATLLRELAGEGRTVLAILHDLNLAARAADRLLFLESGRLLADGPPAEILVPDTIERVFGVASRRVPGSPPAVVIGEPDAEAP